MFKKAVRGLAVKTFQSLALITASLASHADQPPEIISASAPIANSIVVPNAIVSDAAGNTYVTGSFSTSATFGTNSISSVGGFGFDDIYVVKYNPAGVALWAKRAGGDDKEFGNKIVLDGQGGVYVAGTSVSSPAAFGNGNSLFNLYKSLFIARYDANGNCLWARRAGSTGAVSAFSVRGLTVDPAGNPIVVGGFTGNPKFGGVSTGDGGIFLTNRNVASPTSTEDMFVAKFATNGAILWATNHGSSNAEYASAVAVDSTGSIYVTGGYTTATTIGAQTYTNAGDAMFFAKLSDTGDVVWSSNLSDATNNNGGYTWTVAVDSANRINIGFETKTTPFRFRGYAITNLTGGNQGMGVLAQFDTSGNVLWLKRTPFNAVFVSPGNASTLALDALDNIFLGSNGRLLTADESGFQANSLSVLKCTSSGVPLWTNTVFPIVASMTTPVVSVDGFGLTHVSEAIGGDTTYRLTIGWTNFVPFNSSGNNQLLYTLASNYVAVAPQFVVQPTNMFFQPPQALTNFAIARAWPAPQYIWYLGNSVIKGATNPTVTINSTTSFNATNYYVVASNLVGTTTSAVVTAQVRLGFVAQPPTNVTALVNSTAAISASATGTSTISYQWRFNGTNLPGATSSTLTLPQIATNQAGSYTLVISNSSAVITSAPPTLVNVVFPGFVDPSYTNLLSSTLDILRWSDGGCYVALSSSVGHINSNGLADVSGPWAGTTGSGAAVLLQESATQFVVGGTFAGGVARFNTNGTTDATFNTGTGPANTVEGSSFNRVETLVRLPNGQYLVGGEFNKFSGVDTTNIVRLDTNGAVDLTFARHRIQYSSDPFQGLGAVHKIALQSDGKIWLGGEFGMFDGLPVNNLVRLNSDGTIDTTFVASAVLKSPPNGRVRTILPLADGRILVGGAWQNGTNAGVVRLGTDGSIDPTFNGPATTAPTYAIALTAGNKLVIGGQNFLRRTDFNGLLDATFVTGTNFTSNQTQDIIQEPNGNLIVAGTYGVRRLLAEPILIVPPTFSVGVGTGLVNGQFQFSACGGIDGQTFVVQGSADFVSWQNLSTNTVTGGCISYTDSQTSSNTNRFYRLLAVP